MNPSTHQAAVWLAHFVIGIGSSSTSSPREVLWQTHARGDDVHVIDVEKRETIQRIKLGPNPHGIATNAAGRTIFVSLERDREAHDELLWIHPETFEVQHRLPFGLEPHQLAVTPDGRFA